MRILPQPSSERRPSRSAGLAMRLALALALGAAAALLIACGGSGKGLLSAADAGPLKSDIEAVDLAAQEGNGDCTKTEAALARTEQDFASLPASINSGLRDNLRQGITNLRKVATELCAQPLVNTTTTATTTTSTTPSTTPSKEEAEAEREKAKEERERASEEKEKAKEEPEQPAGPGGGTPSEEATGKAPGENAGGVTPEESTGNGVGGQESGK